MLGEPQHEIETADTEAQGVGNASERSSVSEPDRLIRVGSMVRALQEELRRDGSDGLTRERLGNIHRAALDHVREVISGPIEDEFESLTFTFSDDKTPSEAELRLAQAQLLGWLEGLFQGLQAAARHQQPSAAGAQRSLQAGGDHGVSGTGQYL